MKTINAIGLAEIREFLAENHAIGGDNLTDLMIHAWARDAEFQLAEGNPACIEIRAADSVYGRTQEFTISAAGIDSEGE